MSYSGSGHDVLACEPRPVSTTFGEVCERTELSPCDRSPVTAAGLTANGNTEQPVCHLHLGRRNGGAEEELEETVAQPDFSAGWPLAVAAMAFAMKVVAR
jgi:4-carboxymuconolactone decarboxylase